MTARLVDPFGPADTVVASELRAAEARRALEELAPYLIDGTESDYALAIDHAAVAERKAQRLAEAEARDGMAELLRRMATGEGDRHAR